MISEIEKLDALGREKGLVIYNIHQCNAGWGVCWYEGGPIESRSTIWKDKLRTYQYYPTVAEMVEAETKRVNKWSPDAD